MIVRLLLCSLGICGRWTRWWMLTVGNTQNTSKIAKKQNTEQQLLKMQCGHWGGEHKKREQKTVSGSGIWLARTETGGGKKCSGDQKIAKSFSQSQHQNATFSSASSSWSQILTHSWGVPVRANTAVWSTRMETPQLNAKLMPHVHDRGHAHCFLSLMPVLYMWAGSWEGDLDKNSRFFFFFNGGDHLIVCHKVIWPLLSQRSFRKRTELHLSFGRLRFNSLSVTWCDVSG